MTKTIEFTKRGTKVSPEIVDDLTRREFLIGAGLIALVPACGSGEESGEASGETRPYEHAEGTTEVPVRPERVVTLQDQNALLPLWELGFRDVVGSAGSLRAGGDPYFRRMDGFDTSEVEFIGEYGQPNLESVAALEPDLIVADPYLEEGAYEKLSQIAPTVQIDTFDAPISVVMLRFAELVGREAEAEALEEEYQGRLDELRELPGDPGETVVSVISTAASGGAEPGQFFVDGTSGGSTEEVLREVGFARPEAQLNAGERTYFSVENLSTQDGDLLFRLTFEQGADDEVENTEAILGSPLWDRLNAVRLGQAHDVDGEATVGTAYRTRFAFMDVLSEHLPGLDTSGDLSDVEVATP